MTTNFFFHPSLLLLFLDPGSGMGENQDPGSRIKIPDPQYWLKANKMHNNCIRIAKFCLYNE